MQSSWLNKKNRPSCLLFLAGWGMAPEPFRMIDDCGHDLLMVYDYRQIDAAGILESVETYSTIHLLGWSMGVWIAGTFFAEQRRRFASATAVNGTLHPIDEQNGIPPAAFDEMVHNFSPPVLERFYRDMFDQPSQAERFLNNRPDRSGEDIHEELVALRRMYHELGPGKDIFGRKIVCSRDRIFPARSQLRSWGKEHCRRLTAGHFPFYDRPLCRPMDEQG